MYVLPNDTHGQIQRNGSCKHGNKKQHNKILDDEHTELLRALTSARPPSPR